MENIKLLPLVNTESPMSQDMIEALTVFEFTFIGTGIDSTNTNEAIAFLEERDPKLVDQFHNDLLIHPQQ